MAGLLHVILSDFFSRWRPNWLLSAAGRKDTIGERIPLLPDYKSLIRRYYSELWNAWSTTALLELICPDIVFRGSIGTAVNGIEEFKQYVSKIRAEFPDFHIHIEELFGFSGTERKITYQGTAIFQFREGKIVSGFVLGDRRSLKRQIAQT